MRRHSAGLLLPVSAIVLLCSKRAPFADEYAPIELLDAWQPTVIKGNAAEIGALADSNEVCTHKINDNTVTHTENRLFFSAQIKVKAQGVDSLGGFKNAPQVVRSLARTHRPYHLLPIIISHRIR